MAARLLDIGKSHAHECVLPRLLTSLFGIPDKSSESVPTRILLLQTADSSIN